MPEITVEVVEVAEAIEVVADAVALDFVREVTEIAVAGDTVLVDIASAPVVVEIGGDPIILTPEIEEVRIDVTVGPEGPPGPQGPPGADGGAAPPFEFVQNTPSASWTIVHNLGYRPASVSVVDSGGNVVGPAVVHIDDNELVINFGSAFSGTALLR